MSAEAWENIRIHCEEASGPDREIDTAIALAIGWTFQKLKGDAWPYWRKPEAEDGYAFRQTLPEWSKNLSAIVALVEQTLPGWAWKVGTCSVSDDAWLVPDFNCPIHGARLHEQFDVVFEVGEIWDTGIDIDRRPSGNVALALCQAFCEAMAAVAARDHKEDGR